MAMAHKLDLCFTDAVLTLEVVERLLASSPDDIASEIKQTMSQLQRGKKVEELQRLLPVSESLLQFDPHVNQVL